MDTFKAYYQFFDAIKNDDREKITEVLKQYTDCVEWVEKRNLERTGLISAAEANKPELVRFLLENGANPLAKQWAGGTALVVAADQGPSHLKVAQVLLEYPQDLNNLDIHETLPLWKAAQSSNNQKMVNLLIDAGPIPTFPALGLRMSRSTWCRGAIVNRCQNASWKERHDGWSLIPPSH